jgi:hypothetical protein
MPTISIFMYRMKKNAGLSSERFQDVWGLAINLNKTKIL